MSVIDLIREAGIMESQMWSIKSLERFSALVRAEALEEAAKWFEDEEHSLQPKKVAAAIRGLK